MESPIANDSPCRGTPKDLTFSPSYPSGHATVGAMNAVLLAQMVPERRDALFARGWAYGDARVISGVHFPSDIEAGRILGTMLLGLLEQNNQFRADLVSSRRELRRVLGYP
jgi:acid phosphatase (class A)